MNSITVCVNFTPLELFAYAVILGCALGFLIAAFAYRKGLSKFIKDFL